MNRNKITQWKDSFIEKIKQEKIRKRLKPAIIKMIKAVFTAGFCLIILYPIITMVSKSFMDRADLFDKSVILIPKNFTLQNFKVAAILLFFPSSMINSLLLSLGCSILQVISCLLTGYAFGRYPSRIKNILFFIVILTIIIPPQLVMLPMYMQFRFFDIFGIIKMFSGKELDLIGTFSPFWLLSMTATGCKNGLFIFIFRQFFKNMPKEIEEAAMVDGAGAFKTFSGIMLPNAVTPMVTVALFSFVWQYNDVVYSTVFMPFGKLLPLLYRNLERLTTQVYSLLGLTGDDLTMIFYIAIIKSAGVLMMLAPVILIFLIFQRFFVESVERSGITGQ